MTIAEIYDQMNLFYYSDEIESLNDYVDRVVQDIQCDALENEMPCEIASIRIQMIYNHYNRLIKEEI